jgi:SAM-dependent methyltransferase
MSVAYYQKNAQAFFDGTAGLDLGPLWAAFTDQLPPGGRVLDAGCGSGRDARRFTELGFEVDAFDASEAMVSLARLHTGLPVAVSRLQDVDAHERYDGIWCCAAALHVPLSELNAVLKRLHEALRLGGVCYLSFKCGAGERGEHDRTFTDQDEGSLRARLAQVSGVNVLQMWTTPDVRPGREHERWLNSISRRTGK